MEYEVALQSNPNDAPKKDISQLYELVLRLNEEAAIISTDVTALMLKTPPECITIQWEDRR